jgi:hypothetical protein
MYLFLGLTFIPQVDIYDADFSNVESYAGSNAKKTHSNEFRKKLNFAKYLSNPLL